MATGKKAYVKYKYYQVCTLNENGKEVLCDLSNWMNLIASQYPEVGMRVKTIDDVYGRLEQIRPVGTLYGFNFMRMDPVSDAYIVKVEEAARHIDLEEDEYIGRNTVLLYDPQASILMVQQNRGGYRETSLQNYINSFVGAPRCFFRPVPVTINEKILSKLVTRKIAIRIADINHYKPSCDIMEAAINTGKKAKAPVMYIEFGFGRDGSRKESMDYETVSEVVKDIKSNRNCVSKGEIALKGEQGMAVYDLFDAIVNDTISFKVPADGEIGFEFMLQKMMEKYMDSDEGGRIRVNRALALNE